jgi:hypothetical protein
MTITLTVSTPEGTIGTIGIVALPLMITDKPIGTTIITREMLDRLPF